MKKKRFTFAQMDEPPEERCIESGLRVFLAAMVIWVGLYMPGLASQGPVKQLATRLAQEWQATAEEMEYISLKAGQI
jgi:hypothetical protein